MAAKTTKPRISQEDWDNLNEVQQAVLSKLGISPKETAEQRRKREFLNEAQSYILGVYNKCGLCKREWSQKWKMVPSWDSKDGEPYYQGFCIPNGHLILEDKRDDRLQATCECCIKRLMKLPKVEIVRMLVVYARYAATWGGRNK
jgi:hypothetical protein